MKPVFTFIAFITAAACAFTVSAQQMTKDGKRIGTRDDLRACFDNHDRIEATQTRLKARGEKVAADAKEVTAESEQLNKEVKSADEDGLTGLRRTRLERKVKESQAKVATLNEEQAKLKSDAEALEKTVAAYREKCSGDIAFQNDDVAAVKQEREAAGKKD